MKRYRDDFYNPIYKKKETIIATLSKDDKKRIPLIYSLTFTGQSIFGNKKIMDVATIAFFDTAGEDLNSEEIMRTENRYIYNSAGIVLLIDPLQFSEVRAQLPGINLPDKNTEVEDIIIRTAQLIRKAHDIKRDKLIDIPIAVAFSKIDAIDPLLSASSGLLRSGEHDGVFNKDDQEDVQGEIVSLIREWKGANILTQLEHNFENYAFFGLSALGCNPHGTQEIPKLRPRRVEDPFLWLLWKNGLIPGSDCNSEPDPFA
jgi:hypothetical protein